MGGKQGSYIHKCSTVFTNFNKGTQFLSNGMNAPSCPTCTMTRRHACTHARTHARTHACTHARTHARTHTHHTHAHTHHTHWVVVATDDTAVLVVRGVMSPLVPPPSLLIRVRALAASSRALETDDVKRRRISGSDSVCGSSLDNSPVPGGKAEGVGHPQSQYTQYYTTTHSD